MADQDVDDKRQPFLEHLRDLRASLRNSVIALGLAAVICFSFSKQLFVLLSRPLIATWREAGLGEAKLHFSSLVEPFWVYFEISLYAGVFLASPVIFHQLWKFVAP